MQKDFLSVQYAAAASQGSLEDAYTQEAHGCHSQVFLHNKIFPFLHFQSTQSLSPHNVHVPRLAKHMGYGVEI